MTTSGTTKDNNNAALLMGEFYRPQLISLRL
jgi:hypothetical protein